LMFVFACFDCVF